MSVREDEALERWCPFTSAAWASPSDDGGWRTTGSRVGFNRVLIRPGHGEASVGRCIGAGCMAWRTTGTVEISDSLTMVGLTGVRRVSQRFRVGCCGLAGSPGLTDGEATD